MTKENWASVMRVLCFGYATRIRNAFLCDFMKLLCAQTKNHKHRSQPQFTNGMLKLSDEVANRRSPLQLLCFYRQCDGISPK